MVNLADVLVWIQLQPAERLKPTTVLSLTINNHKLGERNVLDTCRISAGSMHHRKEALL